MLILCLAGAGMSSSILRQPALGSGLRNIRRNWAGFLLLWALIRQYRHCSSNCRGCRSGLPVTFGSITEGLPKFLQIVWFWIGFYRNLVCLTKFFGHLHRKPELDFWIAVLAGLFFGGFFIFISQVGPGEVLFPLLISRSCEFLIAVLLLLIRKIPLPSFGRIKLPFLPGCWMLGAAFCLF